MAAPPFGTSPTNTGWSCWATPDSRLWPDLCCSSWAIFPRRATAWSTAAGGSRCSRWITTGLRRSGSRSCRRRRWRRRGSAGFSLCETTRMRITRIDAYRVELPLLEGSYKWSGGNAVSVFDSTVVAASTDSGLVGYGEVCALVSAYLPAYARGAAGIEELAPPLIGLPPTATRPPHQPKDQAVRGHPHL